MTAVDDGDGKLQRWEWVELCASALWYYPITHLEMAAEKGTDGLLGADNTVGRLARGGRRAD